MHFTIYLNENSPIAIDIQNLDSLMICLFSYLFPILRYGRKHRINPEDLYEVQTENRSEQLANKLEKFWNAEVINARNNKKKASLFRVLVKTYGWSFSSYGWLAFFNNCVVSMTRPWLIGLVISCFNENSQCTKLDSYTYVSILIFQEFSNSLCFNRLFHGTQSIGIQMRIALSSLIYRKLLRLPESNNKKITAGNIISLLSTDVTKFEVALMFVHFLWSTPITVVLIYIRVYQEVGFSAVLSVSFMILISAPVHVFGGKLLKKLRGKVAVCSDKRILLLGEIINGIRLIKMQTYEKPFEQLVLLARKYEIDMIAITSYIKGTMMSFFPFAKQLTLFVAIILCVLLDVSLTVNSLYALVMYFFALNLSLNLNWFRAFNSGSVAIASIERIQDFLLSEEMTRNSMYKPSSKDNGIISVKKVFASWIKSLDDCCLKDIEISITSGKLYVLAGPVGAGKTSFLKLLLDELKPLKGHVFVSGTFSYASQEPWLYPGSVRDNILFGSSFDEKKYEQVIEACVLRKDFHQLPKGDRTFVGDSGIMLSGGQRARINLARALYRDADVYLLDDPFSAVDSEVRNQVFEKCFNNYLKNKTCILVAHQSQCIEKADEIIFIENGYINFVGGLSKLQDEVEIYKRIISFNENEIERAEEKHSLSNHQEPKDCKPITDDNIYRNQDEEYDTREKLMEKESRTDDQSEMKEVLGDGKVPLKLYWKYFKSGNSYFTITTLVLSFIIGQLTMSSCDYWLSYWIDHKDSHVNSFNGTFFESEEHYHKDLYVFGTLILGIIFLSITRTIFFNKVCMNASKAIHDKILSRLIGATIDFFDKNNSGRILNRFMKDMGFVDELLPELLLSAFILSFEAIGACVQTLIVEWKAILLVLLIGYIIREIQGFILATLRDVKRLEGNAKSPVLAHVKSSLSGMATIRSSGAQSIVRKYFDNYQDGHTAAFNTATDCLMAFGLWSDFGIKTYVAIVSYGLLAFEDRISSGVAGLLLSQMYMISGVLQLVFRIFTEVSMQMITVERLFQYTKLEQERARESDQSQKARESWPINGEIRFENVSLTYDGTSEPVLKNLDFTVVPGMKVGIVGRTGAGKSSLIKTLFRCSDVHGGSIFIDNVDIKNVKLTDLRRNITILPQEPILFSISLRLNLDPVQEFDDDVLWEALREVRLCNIFDSLDQQLDRNNLSFGQCQLLCLARAILRKNKIVILDEATASINDETDSLIQETMRSKFAKCTVLNVAHRLNTIIDSDKIIVLENGQMVENDHPHLLLQKEEGYFTKMVRATGSDMSYNLKKMAKEAFERKK